jgi:hypothetical protein
VRQGRDDPMTLVWLILIVLLILLVIAVANRI